MEQSVPRYGLLKIIADPTVKSGISVKPTPSTFVNIYFSFESNVKQEQEQSLLQTPLPEHGTPSTVAGH